MYLLYILPFSSLHPYDGYLNSYIHCTTVQRQSTDQFWGRCRTSDSTRSQAAPPLAECSNATPVNHHHHHCISIVLFPHQQAVEQKSVIEKLICQKEDRDGRGDVENFAQDEAVEIYIEPEAKRLENIYILSDDYLFWMFLLKKVTR